MISGQQLGKENKCLGRKVLWKFCLEVNARMALYVQVNNQSY